MDPIAMSTLAGILVILGVLIVLIALVVASWLLLAATYQRTRGGTGRRQTHAPDRVGRIWKIWPRER
jgi:hypothetical protein